MKRYSLEKAEELLIGAKGTPEREEYEFELKLELIGDMIQKARKDRNLTQEQLGELIGVKKAQISRPQSSKLPRTEEKKKKAMMSFRTKSDFLYSLYFMKMKQKKEDDRRNRIMEEIELAKEERAAEILERSKTRSRSRSA